MATRKIPEVSSRKRPVQARSASLVAAVLEAAAQVLRTDGAARFTTARVAERAGVSIGSVYQYFPNKAAILFRLQHDEWQSTTALMRTILEDARRPPLLRLRRLVHAFVASECEEAGMRVALGDAAPLYREAPEARAVHDASDEALAAFMKAALPQTTGPVRAIAVALIGATLSGTAKQFSETTRTGKEIRVYANAMADMFCAYLASLPVAAAPATAQAR